MEVWIMIINKMENGIWTSIDTERNEGAKNAGK